MTLADAHAFAFSLAASLMVSIAIFRAGDGSFSVAPAGEVDADIELVAGFAPTACRPLLSSASRRGGGGGATVRPIPAEPPP